MKTIYLTTLVLLFGQVLIAGETNLAINKPYVLEPAPNFADCTDPNDAAQLTDGQTISDDAPAKPEFWKRQETVGWQGKQYSLITVDLGQTEPIGGLEYTTSSGIYEKAAPNAVFVQVSDDGKSWYELCELVADQQLQTGILPNRYAICRLKSLPVEGKGRFVRFMAIGLGDNIFCDEVRVLAGDKSFLNKPYPTQTVSDPAAFCDSQRAVLRLRGRYYQDLRSMGNLIQGSSADDSTKEQWRGKLKTILERVPESLKALDRPFKTIFPLDPNHADLFRVQAAVWKQQTGQSFFVTVPDKWRWTHLFSTPKPDVKTVELAVMRNEARAAMISMYNCEQDSKTVVLKVSGLENAADVTVQKVLWTDTRELSPVPAALLDIQPNADGGYPITVEPGLQQQVWLTVKAKSAPADSGKRTVLGAVNISQIGNDAPISVPVALTVYPFDYPDKNTLLVGGWDYTNGAGYCNVNEKNMDSFLKHVQARGVNCPWGKSDMLMHCSADADLNVTIDTAEFDQWLARWPNAQAYGIFMFNGPWHYETTFLGQKEGTDGFRTVIKNWLRAWEAHWKSKGIGADQVFMILFDEPSESMPPSRMESVLIWMRAIKDGCPKLNMWGDPLYKDFAKAPMRYYQLLDVVCPNRTDWQANQAAFDKFYAQRESGIETLHLYSCYGPFRLMDPYSYALLQAWDAARVNAKASSFWALGDNNGVTSWNEYSCQRAGFCPIFIDPDDPVVVGGKHLEAIRESAQDYEYIVILRQKIEQLRPSDPNRANELTAALDEIIDSVLSAKYANCIYWLADKDRTISEKARVRILDLLTTVSQGN